MSHGKKARLATKPSMKTIENALTKYAKLLTKFLRTASMGLGVLIITPSKASMKCPLYQNSLYV